MPEILFDRGLLLGDLMVLRDEGRRSGIVSAKAIAEEAAIAHYALLGVDASQGRTDPLAALLYVRLVAETALRIRWMAGEEEKTDSHGRPVVDAAVVKLRTKMMAKRDMLLLAKATRMLDQLQVEPRSAEDWVGRVSALTGDMAPLDAQSMATTLTGRSAYAAYRLCSAMVHPGAGIGGIGGLEPERIDGLANDSAFLCVSWGAAMLQSLGIPVLP